MQVPKTCRNIDRKDRIEYKTKIEEGKKNLRKDEDEEETRERCSAEKTNNRIIH